MAQNQALELAAALKGFLEPDNDIRKLAEKFLANLLKKPESVIAFMTVITQHDDATLRQLAAILLRKKIGLLWKFVPGDARTTIKQDLLRVLLRPQEKAPRMATAHLTALVSKLEGGQWDDLMTLVDGLSQQSSADKELSMVLVCVLVDTMPDALVSQKHRGTLVQCLQRGLSDGEKSAQTAAMRAASAVLGLCNTNELLNSFGGISNGVLSVLSTVIKNKDTSAEANDLIISVFDAFDEIMSRKKIPPQMVDIFVNFSIGVAREASVSPLVRERAVGTLTVAANSKKKTIRPQPIFQQILDVALQLLSEDYDRDLFEQQKTNEDEDEDDLDDLDELEVSRPVQLGSLMLDEIALDSSKGIFEYIMAKAPALLQAPEPNKRKSGILALAQISEGCRDKMRAYVSEIMSFVRATMQDPDVHVCQASGYALTLFVEYLQPEVLEFSNDILNHILTLLNSPQPKVQEKGCFVLDTVGEDMGRHLVPRAQELLAKLVNILSQPDANAQVVRTKGHAMASIGSLVAGVGKDKIGGLTGLIQPVVQHIGNALSANATDQSEEVLSYRSHSTETLGVLVAVCGRELGDAVMQSAWPMLGKNMEIDSSQLHELTFNCWSNIVETYKEEALARGWVNDTVPILLAAIESEQGHYQTKEGVFGGTNIALDEGDDEGETNAEENDEDVGEGDELGGGQTTLRIRTADLDKMAAAIKCYGTYAQALGPKFLPYFGQEQWELITSMMGYFHADVGVQAVVATARCVVARCLADPALEIVKGKQPQNDVSQETRNYVDSFLTMLFDKERLMTEDSKAVMKEVFDAISYIAEKLGVVGIWIAVRPWVEATKLALRNKLGCQGSGDDEEMDEEEMEDHDELMDAVLESIDELAKTFGGQFFPEYWRELEPSIKPYLGAKRPGSDHSMALGTYAEVARAMGEQFQPFFESTFNEMSKNVKNKDPGARSNAVYGLGVIVQSCKMQGAAKAQVVCEEVLKLLEQQKKQPDNVHDNVIGCVARCLAVNPNVASFNTVFQKMCQALPLAEDFTEYDTLYDTMLVLVSCHLTALKQVYPAVLQLLRVGVRQEAEGISEEAKKAAEQALSMLANHSEPEVHGPARAICA